jgi:hypothetical protein
MCASVGKFLGLPTANYLFPGGAISARFTLIFKPPESLAFEKLA